MFRFFFLPIKTHIAIIGTMFNVCFYKWKSELALMSFGCFFLNQFTFCISLSFYVLKVTGDIIMGWESLIHQNYRHLSLSFVYFAKDTRIYNKIVCLKSPKSETKAVEHSVTLNTNLVFLTQMYTKYTHPNKIKIKLLNFCAINCVNIYRQFRRKMVERIFRSTDPFRRRLSIIYKANFIKMKNKIKIGKKLMSMLCS